MAAAAAEASCRARAVDPEAVVLAVLSLDATIAAWFWIAAASAMACCAVAPDCWIPKAAAAPEAVVVKTLACAWAPDA